MSAPGADGETSRDDRQRGHRFRPVAGAVVSIGAEAFGLLLQLLLVGLGWQIIWGSEGELAEDEALLLILWCLVATLYLGLTLIWLNVLVRLDTPDPAVARLMVGHPITRLLSMAFTFGASLLGLTVALDLITSIGKDIHDPLLEGSAVWAMLLSWVLFNWGYARIYFSRFHRSARPPLEFPDTDQPRIVDFAYFAFTNATTFAVSDVRVLDTRMRWTVVWHTTLAFFFNALIIVLTMNVIANGSLFAALFD
ncbi:DUF1345 domain-containing protein [Leucobacter massiliensis]|uniref:DUF1345 domain-containing protein n=1 Tax=Leucobacter massiliensis TaxID=1686285 RepID=A0A2S9QS97_9MICO|nr:DUF1345 domain-containing protein [Leucobacter massiliensis]PRI12464.1 hypothetical protein B4915_02025 [Leucobacter massiliensis]